MEWVKSPSHVWLFATPWNVAHQAPPSMEFSRQEYWSGLPFPSPRDLPNPGIKPKSPTSWADALPSEPPRNPCMFMESYLKKKKRWNRSFLLSLHQRTLIFSITKECPCGSLGIQQSSSTLLEKKKALDWKKSFSLPISFIPLEAQLSGKSESMWVSTQLPHMCGALTMRLTSV